MSRDCVYCGRTKEDTEFTDEHVIPTAVGGNLTPQNPFILKDVCTWCNNVCGSYVDAPFVKSWITHNNKWKSGFNSQRLSDKTVLPLIFYGLVDGLTYESRICDLWHGPCFDPIYHFHEPYPEEPDLPIAVGPHPKFRDEADKGFVFLFLNSNNPLWIPAILRSVAVQFSSARFYLANNVPAIESLFHRRPVELDQLHAALRDIQGKEHKIPMPFDAKHADRFLIKVGLGIGACFLTRILFRAIRPNC